MPVKPPALPRELSLLRLDDAVDTALADGDTVSDGQFQDDYLEEKSGRVLDFSCCLFHRVQFCPCDFERMHFTDCRFEGCDLSGFQMRGGTLRRSELTDCRGTGLMLQRMSLRDVRFQGCQLDYAGFVDSRLQAVRYERCQMAHALFHRCEQKELVLEGCALEHAELVETRLSGVDLSSCELNGLRAAIASLEGTTLSLAQAPVALGLCGVTVKV